MADPAILQKRVDQLEDELRTVMAQVGDTALLNATHVLNQPQLTFTRSPSRSIRVRPSPTLRDPIFCGTLRHPCTLLLQADAAAINAEHASQVSPSPPPHQHTHRPCPISVIVDALDLCH